MRASQSLGRGSFNVGGVSMLEGSDFCRVFAQNNVTGVRVQLLKAHRCHVRPLWFASLFHPEQLKVLCLETLTLEHHTILLP